MRSITFVQAFQYWLKLTALLVPAAILLVVWAGDGSPRPTGGGAGWSMPLGEGSQGLYTTYSIVLATFLGTMGLPHVVVRFYTNPDGRAARRTTLAVLGAARRLLPAAAGLRRPRPRVRRRRGRHRGPRAAAADARRAWAATCSPGWSPPARSRRSCRPPRGWPSRSPACSRRTCSGPALLRASPAFRVGATVAVGVPLAAAVLAPDLSVARAVGLAFAVAASTFCPLLVLGIWWRGLTAARRGRRAARSAGSAPAPASSGRCTTARPRAGRDVLLGQPAAWSVPLAFAHDDRRLAG